MGRFFVYELIDPRDGAVFYVGKGCKNRPYHHTKEARAGKRSRKCDRIRAILADGLSVKAVVVRRFTDEGEAYAHEVERIAEIGLDNLTNVLPGGLGAYASEPGAEKVRLSKTLADVMAGVMRLLAAGRKPMLGPYDMTGSFLAWANRCRKDIGDDKLFAALKERGVTVEVAGG